MEALRDLVTPPHHTNPAVPALLRLDDRPNGRAFDTGLSARLKQGGVLYLAHD